MTEYFDQQGGSDQENDYTEQMAQEEDPRRIHTKPNKEDTQSAITGLRRIVQVSEEEDLQDSRNPRRKIERENKIESLPGKKPGSTKKKELITESFSDSDSDWTKNDDDTTDEIRNNSVVENLEQRRNPGYLDRVRSPYRDRNNDVTRIGRSTSESINRHEKEYVSRKRTSTKSTPRRVRRR